jgi:ring-1,2-phenylacetyl-CoA epoxidase subunit PaaD
MHHIEQTISGVLADSGHQGDVVTVFAPAWTTEWMTETGRDKLRQYGIAPPRHVETTISIRGRAVQCPQCSSSNTELINRFGSTACKSLHRCLDCLEPFDHFKEF